MSEGTRDACAAATQHLVAYVDGELAGAELVAIEGHVGSCLTCRREIEGIRSVGRVMATLPPIEPASDLADRLQARIEREHDGARAARRRPAHGPALRWAVPLAAAATVTLALGSVLYQGGLTPRLLQPAATEAPVAARHAATSAGAVVELRSVAALAEHATLAGAPAAELMPEDLPPDLLARPELYLRLPVVKRLDTIEHFDEVRLQADRDRVGRATQGDEDAWA